MNEIKENKQKYYETLDDEGELICHLIRSSEEHWEFNTSKSKCKEVVLGELCTEIISNYKVKGVWAMFAKTNEQKWVCVQVAQKHNRNLNTHSIGHEIAEDIEIMFTKEPLICNECDNVLKEDRLYFEEVYDRHKCEDCTKNDGERNAFKIRFKSNNRLKRKDSIRNLSRRYDIYHDIAEKYDEIAIVCVQITNEGEDISKTLKKEREYAKEHKTIYFR